jgi:hypothetical protein
MQTTKQKQIVGMKIRTTTAAHQNCCHAMKLHAQSIARSKQDAEQNTVAFSLMFQSVYLLS